MTFFRSLFTCMNALTKMPLETYFIYLGNLESYCIFKTCSLIHLLPTKCFLFNNFIFICLSNTFFINHMLIIKYPPQWDKGYEIPCLMWNLKVYYLMHKKQLLYPVIIHLNLVYTLLLSKMLGSIILLSVPSFSKWFLSLTVYG